MEVRASVARGKDRYALARERLAERLGRSGIRDTGVLRAIAEVMRHELVPEALRDQAYLDRSLFIGEGQTISAPGTVAAMTQALELEGHEHVLEVGTGSGYQAAILSRLAERVVSIERRPRLAAQARAGLERLGVNNVVVYLGDGTRGRPGLGPFDAIVLTAGGPFVPEPLLDQLAPGGRLVGPFGTRDEQHLVRVRRDGASGFCEEILGPCRFVDLVGQHGWAS